MAFANFLGAVTRLRRPKVIVRVLGGLGNQLFSYAAARRLALGSDAELVLDHVSGFVRDSAYRRNYQLDHFRIPCRKASAGERLEPMPRIRRYFKKALNQRRPFSARRYIVQEGVDFDPRLLALQPRGTLFLEGYWQSEGYFKDIEPTIRDDLRIVAPADASNLEMADRIRSRTAVAVHVRFFDAPTTAGSDNAPSDYYARSIERMENLVPNSHYFLFSDEPDAARAVIPLPDSRVTVVDINKGDANAYADLWLMTQCRHFVIANSTFSWWGAWLSASADKHVIAPGFEKRTGKMWWGFDGLLPEEWVKL